MEEFATLDFDVTPTHASRLPEVDFDSLAFGQVFSDHMFVMDFEDGEWQRGEISSFGPMTFSPAMMSLHYMAGEAVDYGYNNPALLGGVLSLIALMGISGYLHLNDDEAPAPEA